MKPTLVFLLLISVSGFGQVYVQRAIDFRDSTNATWFRKGTDNVSVILIDGYLSGKLTGYKFRTREDVLKRAPIPNELIPEQWSPKLDYFIDDFVSYKDKSYRAMADTRRGVSPDKDTVYWRLFEIPGEPVSVRYSFPAPHDTLARSEFPANFVMSHAQSFDNWYPYYDYYAGDVVNYKGYNYMAMEDSRDKNPAQAKDYWQPTNAGMTFFYTPFDVVGISLLYYSAWQDGKAITIPQFITPLYYDNNMGFLRDMSLHFKYDEAIDYLNAVRQPVLFDSRTGYLFDRFILDQSERGVLTDLIRDGLAQQRIKPGKKDVLDKTGLEKFLHDPDKPSGTNRWSVFQDLRSTDLIVTGFDVFGSAKPILRLTRKVLAKVQLSNTTNFTTSIAALRNLHGAYPDDTLRIDSLAPIPMKESVRPAATRFLFNEEYSARIDSGYNKKLLDVVKPAWQIIQSAFYSGELKQSEVRYTPFPWNYTFKDPVVDGQTFLNLRLGRNSYEPSDSLPANTDFSAVKVAYTKRFSANGNYSFSPDHVSILIMNNDIGVAWSSTFDWPSLKLLLARSPSTKPVISMIETGDVEFSNAELLYGLMEDQ